MSTEPASRRADFSPVGKAPLWDGIAYWATIAGVYLMVSLLPPNRSDNWLRFGGSPPD
jgi:hypothetical protein